MNKVVVIYHKNKGSFKLNLKGNLTMDGTMARAYWRHGNYIQKAWDFEAAWTVLSVDAVSSDRRYDL